jgi:NADPH:quinone reductase-like Zn-dependent oxidoreductase
MRELYDAGAVWPPATTRSPLAEAAEAHRLMESSRHIGKILLTTA